MRKITKFFFYLTNRPNILGLYIINKISIIIPTRIYIKLVFRLQFGYKIDLSQPKTFNEKLNWLKLNDRKPIYSKMVDKLYVKELVASIIGDQYVVPCYGAWDDFNKIDFSKLPNKFVLKTNHDSSGATICKDKSNFNYNLYKKKFTSLLKRNYFYHCREWPYKNVKPMVLAEMLLEDPDRDKLEDYKFWCFDGEPLYMYCTIKGGDVYENFFDMNFKPVNISHGYPRINPEPQKPQNFEVMKMLCKKLAKNIPFVRIDFFEINGKIYFGEYTFYDWGGFKPFINYNMDYELGRLINIEIK